MIMCLHYYPLSLLVYRSGGAAGSLSRIVCVLLGGNERRQGSEDVDL